MDSALQQAFCDQDMTALPCAVLVFGQHHLSQIRWWEAAAGFGGTLLTAYTGC